MADMSHICAGAHHFAFTRGPIVGSEDNHGVVEFAHVVEGVEQTSGVVVDVGDHGREHFHVARVKHLLIVGKFIPRFDIVVGFGVTRSQYDLVTKDAELFLTSEAS